MTRTVFCKKLKQDLPGLDFPPMPGAAGQELYEQVSKQAWGLWQDQQTMLINEKRLNLMDPGARKFLQEQMQKFLSGEDFEQAEGYVPPSQQDDGQDASD